ncbi:MAG: DGQHR domain-containing protein, partial [Bacteroidetes bacterium]|nr:DGQHR domain-containing protein [Bacteroidota bacterium]
MPNRIAAAQVIDGQHRLAGLEVAIDEKPEIGNKIILVSITIGLSTKEAASIFLNINSEQKPVPKSLVYDLFGEVEDNLDHVINRASDIAMELNDNEDSPYYGAIKYPGKPRGVGIIDLASVISSLKNHLEPGGIFAQSNLTELQNQKTVILNYFNALQYYYDRDGIWNERTKNPFLTSAGFIGAIEALTNTFIPFCVQQKSFKISTFISLLKLDQNSLLTRQDLKQIEGRTRRKHIKEYLESNLL